MHRLDQAHCFLVFTEGAATFALAASRVHDLLSVPRLSPLDETAPWVIGGFDLHGALTPVVSLCAWLGEPLPVASPGDLIIVTRVRGDPLGIHADAILGNEPALELPNWLDQRGNSGAGSDPVSGHGLGQEGLGKAGLHPGATAEVALPGGRALLLDPCRLCLAADPASVDPVETRLRRFERALVANDLSTLEHRAHRYSGLGVRLREVALAMSC